VKNVTMDDVARRARVSRQTVSRVLHGNDYVSAKTRRQVTQAIKALGYFPDPVARSLAHKRTYLIAVVLTEFTGYNRARILVGAEEEARDRGYSVFICGSKAKGLGEPEGSPLLNSQKYEGLLFLYGGSAEDTYEILDTVRPDLPIVTIGYAPQEKRVTRVMVENRSTAREAVAHLIACGHRRIAQISGPRGRYDSDERAQGYAEALREAGLEASAELTRYADWTPESGYACTMQLLDEGVSCTGFFAHSDFMAIGCMKALKERSLSVPRDAAVVGFDDTPITHFVDPPLTTIQQPYRDLGRTAMRVLIDRINGEKPRQRSIVLPASLVVRGSSCLKESLTPPA
jgi:DNA-binding LacI/PurR family transcriptional regulator